MIISCYKNILKIICIFSIKICSVQIIVLSLHQQKGDNPTKRLKRETMKTLNTITKEREIKLLTELLNADSYLGCLFSGELDLEHIIMNITNDFPIESDTKLAR